MKTNENKSVCAECGGKCCKAYPGSMHPADVIRAAGWLGVGTSRPTLDAALRIVLETGQFCIDWWEGDVRRDETSPVTKFAGPADALLVTQFVRPVVKGNYGRVRDATWGGECIFLGKGGCMLSFADRPRDCRILRPVKAEGPTVVCCYENPARWVNPKKAASFAWLPFQDTIDRVVRAIE